MNRKTFYAKDRAAWRAWLGKSHAKEKEVWLVYFKKGTGKPTVAYNDAVEEALCFGWIDSTVNRVDEERYMQRYTPRHKGSIWSLLNQKRVKKMIAAGLMTSVGLKALEHLKKETSRDQPALRVADSLVPSDDLKGALMRNKKAWKNFNAFAPTHRKLYIWWVATAKRPETRKKRISVTVKRCAQNKKPNET